MERSRQGDGVAAITIRGLTDEVVAILETRARQRGVDVDALAREVIHLGMSMELAAAKSSRRNASGAVATDLCEQLGPLEMTDAEQLWS